LNSQCIYKHIAKAPQANAETKALSKSLQSQPERRISKFSSHAKKKKLKHANTQVILAKKKKNTSLIYLY